MEDKHLSTQESIDLIAKMIENTRRNFNDKGGAMFLIWGYTTIAVTAAVSAAFWFTRNNAVMWLWWALPVIGSIFTALHFRKHKRPVTTHLDKAVGYVWIVFGAATLACSVFSFASAAFAGEPLINILFTVGLLMGMATAVTGLMIKFRPVVIGGFLGMALSFAIPWFPNMWQFVIFAGIFLVAQVIPGHMLNRDCKKEAAGEEAAYVQGT